MSCWHQELIYLQSPTKSRQRAGPEPLRDALQRISTLGSELAPLVTPLHARGKLSSSWLNPLGSKEPRASRGRLEGGKHEHIFTEIGVSLQQKIP